MTPREMFEALRAALDAQDLHALYAVERAYKEAPKDEAFFCLPRSRDVYGYIEHVRARLAYTSSGYDMFWTSVGLFIGAHGLEPHPEAKVFPLHFVRKNVVVEFKFDPVGFAPTDIHVRLAPVIGLAFSVGAQRGDAEYRCEEVRQAIPYDDFFTEKASPTIKAFFRRATEVLEFCTAST